MSSTDMADIGVNFHFNFLPMKFIEIWGFVIKIAMKLDVKKRCPF